MNNLPVQDRVAMASTLRVEAEHLRISRDQILKVADTLDPPFDPPQHSTASHMS